MTCPGCNNDVKGNYCPTCKKSLSLGGISPAATNKAGPKVAGSNAAHLNRSAAMDQKGSGPKVKDKTIDGYEKSNEKQAKYSSHLIAKDRASDFGNMTRSKRWRMAESGLMGLLSLASLIGIIAFFLPFFTRILDNNETPMSGMEAFADTPIATLSLLSFATFIAVLALTVLKLVAIAVPSLSFMHKTPVSIAHAVLSVLALVFAILVFSGVAKIIADRGFNLGTGSFFATTANNGMGTLLLLVAGITSVAAGLAGALTRLKINTLNDSIKGKSNSPSGGAV